MPEGVTRCSNSNAAMSRCPGVERLDRPLEVVGHDLPCAAEPGERLGAERRRAARRARRPTAAASRAGGTAPRCRARGRFAPGMPWPPRRARCCPAPTPSSTSLHQVVLDRHRSPPSSPQRSSGPTIAARPAPRSSRSSRRTFAEQARDRALQPVERRERVLPEREQDVDPKRPVDERGEHLSKPSSPAVVGEVLLRLVEDEVDVAVGLRTGRRRPRGGRPRCLPPRRSRRASARSGGSLQLEKTTTSGSSGSRRSARATLARRSDDFPTPLGP